MTADLSTRYLGLDLAHPVVPSASPLTGDMDHVHALVEAGAPAIVLPSLFEEQIEHNAMAVHHSLELGADGFAETPEGFFPQLDDYNTGPQDYLKLIRDVKEETSLPVIASLNGTTPGGWTLYARILADEGIDALELNTYQVVADVARTAADVETSYLRLVARVKEAVDLPLAVKIGPFFSSTAHMANRLVDAGADALVIFNRFYQPDIDLESLDVVPSLVLSDPSELRLVLRWLAILHGRVGCDLAATTGIHESDDAAKALLAGATITMMASALLRHGPSRLTEVRDGLEAWLTERSFDSVNQARGSMSHVAVPDPSAFERAGYMHTLTSYVPDW
ncbi:MAG TPA: dihydroorotate dehydrogenase-like protein [Acidimicrobiia bacterium]|nr:dihydroorotate dehydrogenase-like protein [Acidimicrobiia bacterium]